MDDLPELWAKANLESCVDILDSQRIPVNSDERERRKGKIPYYGATGQVGWIDDFLFAEELLLIGEDGAPFFDKVKPIAYIITGKSWVNNHAHVLRALQGLTTNGFLKHYLNQFDYAGYVNGTTRLKLTQGSLKAIPVKIPPYDEQRRIVAKLEKLLAKVDACKERLEKIPTILKRFRQSVLAAATLGKLTESWRSEKTAEGDARIVPLKEIAIDFSYGSSSKSSAEGTVPVLRMGNIQGGRLDWSDLVFTSNAEEIDKYRLAPGDVLFNRTNSPELVGKTAIYRGERTAIYAGYLIRVRCGKEILPDYLNYCLNSPCGRDYCLRVKSDGVSQSNINAKKLAMFQINLPPVEEQHEIVRRVEALFKIADDIEKRYEKAKTHIDKLTQSILAQAFRGELVPQDPNDEPASDLLKRIQEERRKQEAEGSPGRRGSKRRVNTINPAE